MRQRFEQQMNLRTIAISDVRFPLRSRDELPPVLKALQYIFVTPELNEKVFSLLENKIVSSKKKTGRPGMDLWHILVLAVVRHALSTNWDRLEYLANYDELLRRTMGVHATAFIEKDKIEFGYQTILDNVQLIDEELLQQINSLIVEAGHSLLKKKEEEELRLKTDSYVLETNVHFPTDLNLLWDSSRKCLDMIKILKRETKLEGWRKIKHIRKTIKSIFRATSQQVFKGKKEARKKQSVKIYLQHTEDLVDRCEVILDSNIVAASPAAILALIGLQHYKDYAVKMIGLVRRRLIEDEVIPAADKIYSIFESHTEWITKGKLNKRVELGHLLLITTDQHNFIVDYKVMESEKDPSQVAPLIERLQHKFEGQKIYSHSFDKGFYSKDNLQALQQSGVAEVIIPKKGKLNKEEKQRESSKEFKKLRYAHSAVESNVNMLEHHGLHRCADKGLHGFKRYAGLSVLAYNLHILGNCLNEQERQKEKKQLKKQARLYKRAA
ncbi:MAG: ISNCY family transposase [Bacteroidota bacterium]|nr:ISNCY family transposase [Bacteroidota bacterium]